MYVREKACYSLPVGVNLVKSFSGDTCCFCAHSCGAFVSPLKAKATTATKTGKTPTVTSNSKNFSLPRAVPNTVSACFAGRRSTPTSKIVQIFARFFDLPFIMYMLLWFTSVASSLLFGSPKRQNWTPASVSFDYD